jgi:hypothetical protein
MMLHNRVVVAFVAWTLLIWTTRIGNIWRDDDLDTAGKVGNTALALSFTVLALSVIVAAWRSTPAATRRAVAVLAGWTVGVWLVRSVDILIDDWSAGFKIVHTSLAVISIALAVLAARPRREGRSKAEPTAVAENGETGASNSPFTPL